MALLNGDQSINVSAVIKELANLTMPGNELKLNADELSTSLNVLVQLVTYNSEANNNFINTSVDRQNIVQVSSNLLEDENSNTWLLVQEVVFYGLLYRALFNWVSSNQNQSNHSDQSQRTLTIQWTNQNSKQISVAGTKRGKTCASDSRLVLKGREYFETITIKAKANILSALGWKSL